MRARRAGGDGGGGSGGSFFWRDGRNRSMNACKGEYGRFTEAVVCCCRLLAFRRSGDEDLGNGEDREWKTHGDDAMKASVNDVIVMK